MFAIHDIRAVPVEGEPGYATGVEGENIKAGTSK